ncbi:MAG: cell wall-binding repeat-containing protein [Eggerthellaceae bacterium]|nr:cell wall-binding repeat-containing protein [Eggerthellaceae bacterium]
MISSAHPTEIHRIAGLALKALLPACACLLALVVFCVPAHDVAFADSDLEWEPSYLSVQAQEQGRVTLAFSLSDIKTVGSQSDNSQACYGYAFAYADTITSGEVHTWKEYDLNEGESEANFSGKGMWATFDLLTGKTEQELLEILYDAVNAGAPAVVYVDLPYGGEHWVTVVGYDGVDEASELSASNFLMIDPASRPTPIVESLTASGYTLRLEEHNVFVSKTVAPVLKGAELKEVSGGIRTVQTSGTTTWNRLYGATALDTMRAIAGQGFTSCKRAIIATSDGYWDALAASGLAGVLNCPILLTEGEELSAQTHDELERLGVTRVIVVGGPAAVSDDVEKTLSKDMGLKVVRLAGDDAIGTANAIYEYGKDKWGDDIIIATADGYYDALSVSPYAYANKAPVLLANMDTHKLSSETKALISASGASRALIAGGPAAVASTVDGVVSKSVDDVVRLYGDDAYQTALAIANWCVEQGMTGKVVGIATGTGYWDALCAAPFLGKRNAPLVLVSEDNLDAVDGFVEPRAATLGNTWIFGGPAAVTEATYDALLSATA